MKKKIALVTGGFSGEAVISYRSANTIFNHLDKDRFDVYKIDINPQGWFYEDALGNKTEVNKNDFTISYNNKKVSFDAVFIGMHETEEVTAVETAPVVNSSTNAASATTSADEVDKW